MRQKLILVFVIEFLASIYLLYLFNLLDIKYIISAGVVEIFATYLLDLLNKRSETRKNKKEEYLKQKEKSEQEHDNEKIYNWLYNETEQWRGLTVGDATYKRWRSTKEIACSVHLTIEQVKKLCYTNKKLTLMDEEDLFSEDRLKPLEEKWAIKEFVR